MTPLTYEGLVDKFLNIINGEVTVDPALVGEDIQDMKDSKKAKTDTPLTPDGKVKVQMNNQDPIFVDINFLSIEQLGVFLQEKAIKIKESYTNFRGNKDASISEIHKFVKQIPSLTKEYKSLNHHIHIAELIKKESDKREFRDLWQMERGILEGESYIDQLEDLFTTDMTHGTLIKCLKLLCLHSYIAGGIKSNKLDSIRRLISQIYGFEYVFAFQLFEKSNLLKRKDVLLSVVDTSTNIWNAIRKPLRLINDSINMARPDDIAYITSGYAPLSVRIMQFICSFQSVQTFPELKQIPGPYIEFNNENHSSNEILDNLTR